VAPHEAARIALSHDVLRRQQLSRNHLLRRYIVGDRETDNEKRECDEEERQNETQER
jgi:hypothetical protein